MPGLTFVPNLNLNAARLLEAAGIDTPLTLSKADPVWLFQRLSEVNGLRRLVSPDPSPVLVRNWIDGARAFVHAGSEGIDPEAIPEARIVDSAASPDAGYRPPRRSPEFSGGTWTQRESVGPVRSSLPPVPAPEMRQLRQMGAPVRQEPALPQTSDADLKPVARENFRSFDAYVRGEAGIAPLPRKSELTQERQSRVPVPPDKPPGRTHRRGIQYPRPFAFVLGAVCFLLARVAFLTVLLGTPLALIPYFTDGESGHIWKFLWVIAAWVVLSIIHLLTAMKLRCRVCTNHLLFMKRCFKNAKAHQVPGLGLIGSLCVHALLFHWFRCMYCGTAIRLR